MTSLAKTHTVALHQSLLVCALFAAVPAAAQETITYTYDSRGRLTGVSHSGGTVNGATASYNYDNADNRTSVAITAGGPCSGVSFTIASNGAVTEGVPSGFTVTRTGTITTSCTVNYATANGTATAGSDYTATSGTLTFTSAGSSTQSVSVPTTDDAAYEGAETFVLNLSAPSSGAALGSPSSATATINDNDSPPPVTINLTSGASINLRTVANSNGYTGSSTANYQFVVGSGVTITGYSGSGIGIDTGSWPSGVTLSLQVNASGIVRGGGGTGGNGGGWNGTSTVGATNGGAGGDAIRCSVPIAITVNSGGTVQAGGGGGGGGGYVTFTGPPGGGVVGGGGGGGGAPNGGGGSGGTGKSGGGNGTAGATGTTSGGGAGGTSGGGQGGNGGTYATAGSPGSGQGGVGGPGAAGYAVRKNGTGCTAGGAGTITGTVG
jgi:YD repeat-containing protein